MNAATVRMRIEPMSVEAEIPRGESLASALPQFGVEFPCGATSLCGGCRVRVLKGSLPTTGPDRLVFSAAELDDGWRLACQARAEMPLVSSAGNGRWIF